MMDNMKAVSKIALMAYQCTRHHLQYLLDAPTSFLNHHVITSSFLSTLPNFMQYREIVSDQHFLFRICDISLHCTIAQNLMKFNEFAPHLF